MVKKTAPQPPVAPLHRVPLDMKKLVDGISIKSVRNGAIPNSAQSQMSKVSGVHHRAAHDHATSIAFDVMTAARQRLVGDDRTAMERTLTLLSPGSAEHFGNTLLLHLTALSAIHAGLSHKLGEKWSESLQDCLDKVTRAIVDIGIKAGKCKVVADGGYHADKHSDQLTKELKGARQLVVDSTTRVGSKALLESIASALLAGPLMDSLTERQGNPNAFRNGEVSPMEALQKNMVDDLGKVLQAHLDTGGAEHIITAILDLMKLPEYIVQGDKGRSGKPDAPVRDTRHPDAPQWLQDRSRDGAPIGYSQVIIDNNQSDMVKALREGQGLQLSEIRNLLSDEHQRGYALGKAEESNRWQAQLISDLTRKNESLKRKNGELKAENALLKHKWLESQARFEAFASGGDLLRKGNSANTQTESDPAQQHASTRSLDQTTETTSNLDSSRWQHAEVSRHRQESDGGNKDIRKDDRSDRQVTRSDRNGDNGLHRAPPRSEDQVDGNHRQKLDGTQQRLERNTHRDDAENTLVDNASRQRQPQDGTLSAFHPLHEFKLYLDTLGLAPKDTPSDPYRPDGPRLLKGETAFREAAPNDLLSGKDVKKWVDERFNLSGQVFGKPNFSIGTAPASLRSQPVDPTKTEFADLARGHGNSLSIVKPSDLLAQIRGTAKPQQPVPGNVAPERAPVAAHDQDLLASVVNNVLARKREERSAAFNEVARTLTPGAWLERDSKTIDLEIEDISGSLPDLTLVTARDSDRIEPLSEDFSGSLPDLNEIPDAADELDWAEFTPVAFGRSGSVSSGSSNAGDVRRAIVRGSTTSKGLQSEHLQADGSPVRSFAPAQPTPVAPPVTPQLAAPEGRRSVFSLFDQKQASRQDSFSIAQRILQESKYANAKLPENEKPRAERKGSLESFGSQTSYESIAEDGFSPNDMIVHKSGWQDLGAEDSGNESPVSVGLGSVSTSPRPVADASPADGQVDAMRKEIGDDLDRMIARHIATLPKPMQQKLAS